MFQTEDDLFHREPPFTHHPRGVKQHKASHQTQDQMAIVGSFAVHLTGPSRQQVLQSPKAVLNPVAPLPCPDEPRRTEGSFQTHHVILIRTGLLDNSNSPHTIRWTGGPPPHVAPPRHLLTIPPRPLAVLLQVMALDLAPIRQLEGVGTFPFHEECPLVGCRDMAHELRIAKPT